MEKIESKLDFEQWVEISEVEWKCRWYFGRWHEPRASGQDL